MDLNPAAAACVLIALGVQMNTACFVVLCAVIYVVVTHYSELRDVVRRSGGALSARIADVVPPRVTKNVRYKPEARTETADVVASEEETQASTEAATPTEASQEKEEAPEPVTFETLPGADFYKSEPERRRAFQRPNVPVRQDSASRARLLDSMYMELVDSSSRDPYMRPAGAAACETLRGQAPRRTW